MTIVFDSSSKDPVHQPTVWENHDEYFDVGNAQNSTGIDLIDCH